MESSSNRKSGSSERSKSRKRVVIAAGDSTRDRYSSLEASIVEKRDRAPSGRRPVPGTLTSAGRRVAGNKAEEREVRKRAQRRAVRLRVAAAVLFVGAVVLALVWLYRSPAFTAKTVDVVGAKRLTREQILTLAALPTDVTLLRLPSADIEARLEKSPWVSSAEVTRDFPDTIRLRVVERTPSAVVSTGGKARWLVDGTGIWLAPQSANATSASVLVRDVDGLDPVAGSKTKSETLLNVLEIVAQLDPTFMAGIRAISAPSIDKTALVTRDDVEVFVGSSDDIGRKQQVAKQILKDQAGKVVYINVRTVDRPTWRGLDDSR